MTQPLPRVPISSSSLTRGQLKLSVGSGLRFQPNVDVGWQVTPSVGMVARNIDRLGLDIRSFKEPLTRSVKKVMIPSIRKNFDKGGRPEPWEPLSEATIKLRGSAWPVLIRSGRLRRAATQFNIWTIDQITASVRKLPESVWYGALHQEGFGGFGAHMRRAAAELGAGASARDITSRAFEMMDAATGGERGQSAVHIPPRRFIMFQEPDDLDDIQQIFFEWMVERVHRVGRFRSGSI